MLERPDKTGKLEQGPEVAGELAPQNSQAEAGPTFHELPNTFFHSSLFREEMKMEGLRHPVELITDEQGVVTIKADCLRDVTRAQGYVHATERFFQMDLTRRKMSGHLSEVFGEVTLDSDVRARKLGFAHVAEKIYTKLPRYQQKLLVTYAAGVNAALKSMEPPAEFAALQIPVHEWKPSDCVLNVLAMFDALQSEHLSVKESLAQMKEDLPPAVYDFLVPQFTRYDSPLEVTETTPPPPHVPGPEELNLRNLDSRNIPKDLVQNAAATAGSNNWAISGDKSVHGRSIVVNDPHLDLALPNIWFRNELEWQQHRVRGVSNPGTPGIIIGSNEHISWGFTNTAGDFQNYVVIEESSQKNSSYKVATGQEPFITRDESIKVRGREAPVVISVRETRWGPVVSKDTDENPLALHWEALQAGTINLDHLRINTSRSVEGALTIARTWYGPSQNFVVGDKHGNIGWTITGFLNNHPQTDPRPVHWSDASGLLEPANIARPSIMNPENGFLYSANQRTVDGEQLNYLGNFSSLGVRAQRIKELLEDEKPLCEADLYNIQLDLQVAILEPYRTSALKLSESFPGEKILNDTYKTIRDWDGTANLEQRGIAILEEFRHILHEEVIGPVVSHLREKYPNFAYRWNQVDEPVLRILEERPLHLLPANFESYDDLILQAFKAAFKKIGNIAWKEQNQSNIFHPLGAPGTPLAEMFPGVTDPMAGHPNAVRVSRPGFGASMRMVVAPGLERNGILQIAGGQSGDPHADTYLSNIADWLDGVNTPFVGGVPASRRLITPDHRHETKVLRLEQGDPDAPILNIQSNPLDDHILHGRHRGVLTRGVRQSLKFLGLTGLLAEHQALAPNPRSAEKLHQSIKEIYQVPSYEEVSLRGPKEVLGTLHYKGALLIEGRLQNFEFYLPKDTDAAKPFMLNLPVTQGGYHLMSLISLKMARSGIASGAIERRGKVFEESETPRRMEYELRQSIRDQRAFLDWISQRPEINDNHLGCIGVSLGGIVGSVLTAVEPKIDTAVLVLAGADIPEIMHNSKLDIIRNWMKEYQNFKNLSLEEVEHKLHYYINSDPRNFAQYIEPERVLLINGKYDKIVPTKNGDLLYELMGEPERIRVPFGHYSSLLSFHYMLNKAIEFAKKRASQSGD